MVDKFTTLPIFKVAHELVLEVYGASSKFPVDERFGLVSQIRRSASSVITNVIEGNSRGHRKEFIEFLYIANGSLEETKYHLLLSRDLSYIDEKTYDTIHDKTINVSKQLVGLLKYWKNKEI